MMKDHNSKPVVTLSKAAGADALSVYQGLLCLARGQACTNGHRKEALKNDMFVAKPQILRKLLSIGCLQAAFAASSELGIGEPIKAHALGLS